METSRKIDVFFDDKLINHLFLDYMTNENRLQLEYRLANGISIICVFRKDNEDLFVTAIDIEDKCIHVREVGGSFGRIYDILDDFVQGFAKFCGKDEITFNTGRRAVVKWAEKQNYTHVPNTMEYKKVLH